MRSTPLADVLREHRLKPAAVLLTHGHIDHMWSVLPVCGEHEVAAYVHPADRDRIGDPVRTLPPELVAALGVAGSRSTSRTTSANCLMAARSSSPGWR